MLDGQGLGMVSPPIRLSIIIGFILVNLVLGYTHKHTSNVMLEVKWMKSRVRQGRNMEPTESTKWVTFAEKMVRAVLKNQRNVHKYYSGGASSKHRKPSACFTLNVGKDDFALCIEAEAIVKKVKMSKRKLRRFMNQWKNVAKRERITQNSEEKAKRKKRRARFEKGLRLSKLLLKAGDREKSIMKLETEYLDEKYGIEPAVQKKKASVKKRIQLLRKGKNRGFLRKLAKKRFFTSIRTEDAEITHYVNLFDVPCPDDEYGSLCTQFCCQRDREHDLFCNLLIECY